VIFLLIFISVALIVITLTAVLNGLTFPRLNGTPLLSHAPSVSILIPARNEAAVIGKTLESLLTQEYPNFEVILLDDNSTDGTGGIASSIEHKRLSVIEGQPLPRGWLGKNWACHQLSEVATGERLIFTDADVRWSPGALNALVAQMEQTNADLLTVWPTQQTYTWSERLIVPLMALAILGYLPVLATHYLPLSIFAAACGQCMAWKREAYMKVGGHNAVADNVLEDVTMARYVKREGLRLRMADGHGLISCRMYQSWETVRNGYAKNILAGYGHSIIALLIATVFHWIIFVLPPLWLMTGWFLTPDFPQWFGWAACLTTLGIGVRMLTAATTRQRLPDALLMPISAILMTIIAFQSIYWRFTGGRWKGRSITKREKASWQSKTLL
jgi:chlorobactene glucosyltransferase